MTLPQEKHFSALLKITVSHCVKMLLKDAQMPCYLCRTVDGREDWQTVCYTVLTEVQKFINRKYGTKLEVNSFKFTKYSVAHLETS